MSCDICPLYDFRLFNGFSIVPTICALMTKPSHPNAGCFSGNLYFKITKIDLFKVYHIKNDHRGSWVSYVNLSQLDLNFDIFLWHPVWLYTMNQLNKMSSYSFIPFRKKKLNACEPFRVSHTIIGFWVYK